MSLKRNFSFGFASSVWGALLSLAVVPLYIKYLGTEAYGLIGFFVTTQALLGLLDMGLSPTINREVARCSASGNMQEARNLLHTLAVVYWVMAALIALVVIALAPLIADYWLQPKHLSKNTVTDAVMLMGMVVACRWPVGLYMGAMMGMQRIALFSAVSSVVGTLSSLGAVIILMFISPTIEAFFIWQACVGLAYAIAMRWVTWKLMISKNEPSRFHFDNLKRIWRFSVGMSAISISAAILTQLDKVLLSRMLSLEDFGRYSLACVVASGLYVLFMPIFNAIYPRFSTLVAIGDTQTLTCLYRIGTRMLSSVLFPLAILMGVFSEDLICLWTRNSDLAIKVAPIVHLLLMGTAINGVMVFPYALQLAYGMVRLPLMMCLILITGTVPMTIFLAMKYGAIGGALSWVIMNSIYLLMNAWLTHRIILKDIGFKWLLCDVATPLIFSLIILTTVGDRIHSLELSHFMNIFIAMIMGLLSIIVLMVSSPLVVNKLSNSFKDLKISYKIVKFQSKTR